MGGGLGIRYHKEADDVPKHADYIKCFDNFDDERELELIFEPGRSLVGNAAILVGEVLGKRKSLRLKNVALMRYQKA